MRESLGPLQPSAGVEPTLRFRRDVRSQRLSTGELVLISPRAGRTIKVGAAVEPLLPILFTGAEWTEFLEAARHVHGPRSSLAERLAGVVEVFRTAGLLEGAAPHRSRGGARKVVFGTPDAIAAVIARAARIPRPLLALAVGVPTALSVVGLISTLSGWDGRAPEVGVPGVSVAGGAFLLVVVVHELAHAVACRCFGAPVSGWGVMLYRSVFPVPFVDTSAAALVPGRLHRVVVPLAGPIADLWCAGLFAGMAAVLHGSPAWVAGVAATVAAVALAMDLNPFARSDAVRILGALSPDRGMRAKLRAGHIVVYLGLSILVALTR